MNDNLASRPSRPLSFNSFDRVLKLKDTIQSHLDFALLDPLP